MIKNKTFKIQILYLILSVIILLKWFFTTTLI
jgi:hypothetical protein